MRATRALRELNDLTASQWGLLTTAQAQNLGVGRLQLSRLAEAGHLERVSHGIYRSAGAPTDRFELLKAAWLSVNPSLTAEQRLAISPPDAVISGATAAFLHRLGDLVPEPYEFTVPRRRQTQRSELRFRVRTLPESAITITEGMPVTSPEQTLADLVEARTDLSLVTDALTSAPRLDTVWLAQLLDPLAHRNGARSGVELLGDLLDHGRAVNR